MSQPDAREALRRAIAQEHRLHQEARGHQQLADRWQRRAELALRRGEPELASAALSRQVTERRLASDYFEQAQAVSNAIRAAKRQFHRPSSPPAVASEDDRLRQLAIEDRLERDLAALKAQLNAAG